MVCFAVPKVDIDTNAALELGAHEQLVTEQDRRSIEERLTTPPRKKCVMAASSVDRAPVTVMVMTTIYGRW
jgi:hypothetical protein